MRKGQRIEAREERDNGDCSYFPHLSSTFNYSVCRYPGVPRISQDTGTRTQAGSAPPTPAQPSQSALPQRPDVPGFLAVPQAGRRCLLSLGFAPGCGGPTPPQPSSRVTGEVKDRLLRSSTRILRMLEEAAARSLCQAYRQVSCHGLSRLARVGQTRGDIAFTQRT